MSHQCHCMRLESKRSNASYIRACITHFPTSIFFIKLHNYTNKFRHRLVIERWLKVNNRLHLKK